MYPANIWKIVESFTLQSNEFVTLLKDYNSKLSFYCISNFECFNGLNQSEKHFYHCENGMFKIWFWNATTTSPDNSSLVKMKKLPLSAKSEL